MNQDIHNLFNDELNNIYYTEEQLLEAYPMLEDAAQSLELKTALHHQAQEIKDQLNRLETIFQRNHVNHKEISSGAILGLIQECKEAIQTYPQSALRDAALIARIQRIKHYEISVYGTLVAFADELDLDEAIDLFRDSLDGEANADQKLTDLAAGGLFTTGINHMAHQA